MPQPMFGRKEEFGQLWSAWEQAQVGKGSFVILEGEAGIGKTALATKLVNQVHVSGGSVCFVRCYRTEKSVPFAPITTLIKQLSRLPGFVGLDPVWIGELTRLVPELRERYPTAPQAMAVDDAAKHRLSDATLEAVLAVADEQPLLIIVDDLQDADEATLAAMHYLGRQGSARPSVIIGARRLSATSSELERIFFETAKSFGRLIRLAPLDEHEINRLVLQVFASRGKEPEAHSLSDLVNRVRGNPLHAIEAALALCDGNKAQVDERNVHSSEEFDESAVERLNRLSMEARQIVITLAAAGRPLTDFDVASTTGLQPTILSSGLSLLEESHFIKRSGGTVTFSHERYSSAAYGLASDKERQEVHLRLAELLLQSAARNPAARYEVANHYSAAGRLKNAKAQALAAARYAKSLGAERERLEALELAMRVTDGFDSEIATQQGKCFLELREYDRLHDLCARASRHKLSHEIAIDFAYLATAVDFYIGQSTLSSIQERLEDLAQSNRPFEFLSAAKTLLMRVSYRNGDHATTRRVARSLRKESQPGTRSRGYAIMATAFVAAKYYHPRRALPLLQQALALAHEEHDLSLEHLCRIGLGAVHRQLGRFSESVHELELALALARRIMTGQLEAWDLADIAVAEMSRGNVSRSKQLFSDAQQIIASNADGLGTVFILANWGELDLTLGNFEAASARFQSALEHCSAARELTMSLQAMAGLALCAQRCGNLKDLSRWSEQISTVGAGVERTFHDRWMIEAALAWDLALNKNRTKEALSRLLSAASELERRDIDHSLNVRLERLRIEEHCLGKVSAVEAAELESETLRLGAGTVQAGLRSLLLQRPAN